MLKENVEGHVRTYQRYYLMRTQALTPLMKKWPLTDRRQCYIHL